MNRFDESPMFNTPSWDRDEDGRPCPEPTEVCEYCDATVFTLETAAWDDNLRVCESCAAGEPEPECQCYTDGDSYDPRGCELHDASSTWNARMSAIREDAAALVAPILPQLEAAVQRKREAGRADDLLCHFSGCGIWVNEGCDCMYGEVA